MSLERAYINCKKCRQTGWNESQNEAMKALEDERASLERVNGGDIGTLGGSVLERYNAVKEGLESCLRCSLNTSRSRTVCTVVESFIQFAGPEQPSPETISDFPKEPWIIEPQIILDPVSEGNGEKKVPKKWIEHWNQVTDGRYFASMADLYQAFKQLREASLQNRAFSQNISNFEIVDILRNDCDWQYQNNWLVTSTSVIYDNTRSMCQIIHHFGCKDDRLIKTSRVDIPAYDHIPIAQVAQDSVGLSYLQAYFDTQDSAEQIIQTCKFTFGYDRERITVWTPELRYRASQKVLLSLKAAGLTAGLFSNNGIFTFTSDTSESPARSRGVRYA